MRALIIGIAVVGILAVPSQALAVSGDPSVNGGINATVPLEVNIVPFVSIELDLGNLVIDIPAGGAEGSGSLGGHVTTNTNVSLTAEVTKKPVMLDGAGNDRSVNADWTAVISEPMQSIAAGTTKVDDNLLTVSVSGISGQVIAGNLTGGIVTITIMAVPQ